MPIQPTDIEKKIAEFLDSSSLTSLMQTSRHFLRLIGTDNNFGHILQQSFHNKVADKLYLRLYPHLRLKLSLKAIDHKYPWLATRKIYSELKQERDFEFEYNARRWMVEYSFISQAMSWITSPRIAYMVEMLPFILALMWHDPEAKNDLAQHYIISLMLMFNLGIYAASLDNPQSMSLGKIYRINEEISLAQSSLNLFGVAPRSELSKLVTQLGEEHKQQIQKAKDDKIPQDSEEFPNPHLSRVSYFAQWKYEKLSLARAGLFVKQTMKEVATNQINDFNRFIGFLNG